MELHARVEPGPYTRVVAIGIEVRSPGESAIEPEEAGPTAVALTAMARAEAGMEQRPATGQLRVSFAARAGPP